MGWAVVVVEPAIMGAGPVPAIRKLLDRTRLTVSDIDHLAEEDLGASRRAAGPSQ